MADGDHRDAVPGDGRDETPNERLDRNWNELLQELRVTQTGTQIMAGFLLTLPFQSAFANLDAFQRTLYLTLILLAVVTTLLGLGAVAMHRILFRQGAKSEIVQATNRMFMVSLAAVALLFIGTVLFIFDVVAGRVPALIAAGFIVLLIAGVWIALPVTVRSRIASRIRKLPDGTQKT